VELCAQGAEKSDRKSDSFLSESRTFETLFISQKHFKAANSVKMRCRKKLPFHGQLRLVQPSPARLPLLASLPDSRALPGAHHLFFCH